MRTTNKHNALSRDNWQESNISAAAVAEVKRPIRARIHDEFEELFKEVEVVQLGQSEWFSSQPVYLGNEELTAIHSWSAGRYRGHKAFELVVPNGSEEVRFHFSGLMPSSANPHLLRVNDQPAEEADWHVLEALLQSVTTTPAEGQVNSKEEN